MGHQPFDQWGVELGKILGKVVEADITAATADPTKHDSSTSALIARARKALKRMVSGVRAPLRLMLMGDAGRSPE